jgi:hypothetical protein
MPGRLVQINLRLHPDQTAALHSIVAARALPAFTFSDAVREAVDLYIRAQRRKRPAPEPAEAAAA